MIRYSSMTAIAVPKRSTTRTRIDRQQPPEGHCPEHLPLVGAVDAGGVEQIARNRRQPGQEEHGVVAETPPPLHDGQRGNDELVADPLRLGLNGEEPEDIDQNVVDRTDVAVVHPVPEDEDQRPGNHRRDEQNEPIEGRQLAGS